MACLLLYGDDPAENGTGQPVNGTLLALERLVGLLPDFGQHGLFTGKDLFFSLLAQPCGNALGLGKSLILDLLSLPASRLQQLLSFLAGFLDPLVSLLFFLKYLFDNFFHA